MPRKIEVFTAGCPLCQETVDLVKNLACPECQITVYDLRVGCETMECRRKAHDYGITALPAVVVDGQLLEGFKRNRVTAEELKAAGIGQPLG